MKAYELTGRRILVTGASSGIGRACAIAASEMGAVVILTGRRTEALEETRSCCHGEGHIVVAGDITSSEFIAELVEKAGKLDGLVHAAGIAPMLPVGMLTDEHITSVMKTNYYSFLELMKYYSKLEPLSLEDTHQNIHANRLIFPNFANVAVPISAFTRKSVLDVYMFIRSFHN